MADVLIFGAGGLGRMVRDLLLQAGNHRPVAFLDSDSAKHHTTIDGLTVVGNIDQLPRLLNDGVHGAIVAIGDNYTRAKIAEDLRVRGAILVSAIHPLVSISPTACLDEHLIIGPRVCICVHARIGEHCVLSPGSIIEHDNVIGRAVFVHPAVRLAGTVCIDDFVTIGIGACVIPGRRVGRGAQVEAGAVVISDVAPGKTVGGVPAMEKSTQQSHFVPESLPQLHDLPTQNSALDTYEIIVP